MKERTNLSILPSQIFKDFADMFKQHLKVSEYSKIVANLIHDYEAIIVGRKSDEKYLYSISFPNEIV